MLRRRYWAPYLDFIRYAWHAQMTNEFEGHPDVMINGMVSARLASSQCMQSIASFVCL